MKTGIHVVLELNGYRVTVVTRQWVDGMMLISRETETAYQNV